LQLSSVLLDIYEVVFLLLNVSLLPEKEVKGTQTNIKQTDWKLIKKQCTGTKKKLNLFSQSTDTNSNATAVSFQLTSVLCRGGGSKEMIL
jgi:hypothetical protein